MWLVVGRGAFVPIAGVAHGVFVPALFQKPLADLARLFALTRNPYLYIGFWQL